MRNLPEKLLIEPRGTSAADNTFVYIRIRDLFTFSSSPENYPRIFLKTIDTLRQMLFLFADITAPVGEGDKCMKLHCENLLYLYCAWQ